MDLPADLGAFLIAVPLYFVLLLKWDDGSWHRHGLRRWRRFSGAVLAVFLSIAFLNLAFGEKSFQDSEWMFSFGVGLVAASLIHLFLDQRELRRTSLPAEHVTANESAVDSFEPLLSDEDLERMRHGHVDAALKARIEAMGHAVAKRADELTAIAESMSKDRAKGAFTYALKAQGRLPSKRLGWTAVALSLAVVPGSLLKTTFVGPGFLFAYSEQYQLVAFALVIPFAWLVVRVMDKPGARRMIEQQFPTRWLRRYLAYPTLLLLVVAAVFLAPLGWISLAGWAIGSPFVNMPGTVVKASEKSGSDCSRQDVLEVNGISGSICLRGRFTGLQPRSGDAVTVSGRISSLGVYVEEVSLR